MKKDTIYEYDPGSERLNVIRNGKPIGGFINQSAEREFSRLLESGADIKITDMSNSIKSARVRRLRAMWVKQGIDQYRDSILEPYGVTSTADLTLEQLDELIDRYANQAPASEHIRRQRSVALDLLTKLGVYKDGQSWDQVNAYLMQPRIAGKLLYQMSSDELNALQHKLRAILAKGQPESDEVERQKLLN